MKVRIIVFIGITILLVAYLMVFWVTKDTNHGCNMPLDGERIGSKVTDWERVVAITNRFHHRFIELKTRSKVNGVYHRNMIDKAIRNADRELWEELTEVMTYEQLKNYKLNHSWIGRHVNIENEWFNPSKNEIRVLLTAMERYYDYIDENYDGDFLMMKQMESEGKKRREDIMFDSGMSLQERIRILNTMKGDAYNTRLVIQNYIRKRFSIKRYEQFIRGPDPGPFSEHELMILIGPTPIDLLETGQIDPEEYDRELNRWFDEATQHR